jgi:hypothetical protein
MPVQLSITVICCRRPNMLLVLGRHYTQMFGGGGRGVLDWGKLLIRIDRPDTPEMLGYWGWLVGREFHPLVMTKFGDWFLADPQGRVHWLDLIEGTLSRVADSVEEFERLMVQPDQLDEWFLLGWCDALYNAGQVPRDGQCFGFKVPPKLGAPVDLLNVEVAELKPYQLWMAQVHKIPPGTTVDAFTVDGKLA